ncbi:site-specific integrase, partial [Enterococcus faecium]
LNEQNNQALSIQERLGHAYIQLTFGTYGHLYAKSDQQVVSAIDNVQEGPILSKNDNLLPV